MNADRTPATALKDLLAQHGQQLAFDPDATLKLLSEACPTAGREVEAIVAAQRLRIPWELLNSGIAVDPARLDVLAKTLADQTQMQPDAARWIIQTWLKALDVTVQQGAQPEPDAQQPAQQAPDAAGAATVTPSAAAPTGATYYVLAEGGAKYGPADVATLNQWAVEGRIHQGTMFEDSATGRSTRMYEISGLFVPEVKQRPGMYEEAAAGPQMDQPGGGPGLRPEQPQGPYSAAPQYQANYAGQVADPSLEKLATWALVVSAISFLLTCCFGLLPLILAILGRNDIKAGNYSAAKGKLMAALIIGAILIVYGLIRIPAMIDAFQTGFQRGLRSGAAGQPFPVRPSP